MYKKKAIVQEGDCKCFLRVGIHRAEHIDNATKHSMPRFYVVHGWVADKAILSEAVLGMPNPEWQMLFTIRLGNYEPNQFLHLEVIRTSPTTDPGSSNGFAIVGRTKIPLPKFDHKNTAPYELVMQEGSGSLSPAGHIIVTLELKRRRSERSSGRGGYNEEGGVSDDDNKPYFLLHLHIKSASNVDQLVGPFVPTRNRSRYYLVIITDSQYSTQCKTQIVEGNPAPFWGCNLEMEFDEFPKDVSLFVEVLELGNKHDPGTSTGVVVVGRAQIPVPTKRRDFGWRRQGLVTLMGSETKVEGFIELHMELKLQNGTDFP